VSEQKSLPAATHFGVAPQNRLTQGCSFLATLGFVPKSRWDLTWAISRSILTQFVGISMVNWPALSLTIWVSFEEAQTEKAQVSQMKLKKI